MGVTKVERIRLPSARASCTRWSVVYNIIFVLNLASTPFMAYLAEPRPGGVVSNMPPTWSTFDDSTTMGFHQISRRDFDTNTFAIRHEMTLPFEVSKGDIFKYLIRMPAPGFFGNGIRNLTSSFLTSNETSRQRLKPWQMCQHNRLLSLPYSQMRLWIVQGTEASQYTVWLASHIDESIETCWIKFVLRVILALYILYLLWTRYYCHYKTLLSNLRQLGFSPEYIRYEVVVGDPAYAILSDPVVSLPMVLDIWIGSGHVTLSLIRVTQFHDVSMYISGCMYLSRFVWFTYLGMRALSSLIKWRRWEASYAPVDPAFLAICTYLYNGPGMTLFCTTKMVLMFYDMALHFQPAYLENQAIEGISAIASMSFLMSILPFIYSRLSKAYSRCKSIYRVRPMGSRLESIKLSQFSYNDVKARILLAITMKKHVKRSTGGTLHKLHQDNPRYRKIPLASHRAGDCFVLCYKSNGSLDQQIRLSLLDWLDPLLSDPEYAIPQCTSRHENFVCLINFESCSTLATPSMTTRCIHGSELDCQWVN